MLNVFPLQIVDDVAHRPWPLPEAPWVMTQSWHDLLFVHWPVNPLALREHVAAAVDIDLYEGQAWLAVVPFDMTNVAPRFVPSIPGMSAFPEINVRTYVTSGGKPGVYFLSLDAESAIAVGLARAMLRLPYFTASMDVTREDEWIDYWSERHATPDAPGAEFAARYRPTGPAQLPSPGSLEYFLTERYCLYNVDAAGQTYRLDIHHPRWALQPAEAEITINTMAAAAGIALPAGAPLLHYVKRQDTLCWLPERL